MSPDTLKLYHSTGSPNSRRVRIFLAEKGLKVPLVAMDLGKGEQHSAAYRAINPRRVVPTLVLDDGTAIGERTFSTTSTHGWSRWNAAYSRMEMYLVSRKDQIVNAAGHTFAFRSGERLHTENSHKFTVDAFAELAIEAGWAVTRTWTSDAPQVAVFRLESNITTSSE